MPNRRFSKPVALVGGLALATLLPHATPVRATSPTTAGEPAIGASEELVNVSAFARAYGVIRYFYPSDAAASLDWDRLAVLGAARVRPAHGTRALRAALADLFGPLGPGIEFGASLPPLSPGGSASQPLVAWRYLGPAIGGTNAGPYSAKRTHRASLTSIDGFATLMQSLPADAWRGRSIRVRAQVRSSTRGSAGSAALWLRVDRPNQVEGFFDNMADRPIRERQWREYVIEGTVADDAAAIAFGVMASGAVTADFDAFELAGKDVSGGWTAIPIDDPGFERPLDAEAPGWLRAGTSKNVQISRPGERAPEGRQFLRFEPPTGSDAELFDDRAPIVGAHADIDLGQGLKARVPLTLTDAQARTAPWQKNRLDALTAALATLPNPSDKLDLDWRLAGVIVAWNAYRHFYPYWTETGVDWDRRLQPQLEAARGADSRIAQRDALRALVADARDGHGAVADLLDNEQRAALPVQLGVVEDRLVITASNAVTQAPVGAVVLEIDGVPAAQRLDAARRAFSGGEQWRQVRAAQALTLGRKADPVRFRIDSGSGPRDVTLRYEASQPPPEKRPQPVAELAPAIWYVDLTRATMAAITPLLDKLAAARGVVFDLRGYPQDAGSKLLPHLISAPENDRWMHVAKLVGPFGQTAGWLSSGWDLAPSRPRLNGKLVFLTDARAISYAESVLGYVADRRLGTVVGGTTAGANGNIVPLQVPGGFRWFFTGMRVTRHDGRTQHHLVGVKPDIPLSATIAGLRGGHDELLDCALALIRPAARAAPGSPAAGRCVGD